MACGSVQAVSLVPVLTDPLPHLRKRKHSFSTRVEHAACIRHTTLALSESGAGGPRTNVSLGNLMTATLDVLVLLRCRRSGPRRIRVHDTAKNLAISPHAAGKEREDENRTTAGHPAPRVFNCLGIGSRLLRLTETTRTRAPKSSLLPPWSVRVRQCAFPKM